VVPHLHEHFDHVDNAKLAGIRLFEERAHVFVLMRWL
jgi:hypothetical protein